ncbi:MAG: hypothetical protein SCARUB_01631 [Candidatus Scalindua rubra]|uniref:Uncharacterized protein n=1 Tax=Candidatus Scalindua rubra TaxID=1872076 RepID=A0A1E3XCB4_9BACT|nr:MAG: hypothetical protein SCARUB_01631 [Candidatus Scalindua rubra]
MKINLKSYVFHFYAVGFFVIFPLMPLYAELSNEVLLEKINSLQQTQTMILEQIRILREDMNKRFEQVDERFEQVDKRFEFIQNLLVALIVILVGTTIYSVLGKTKEKKIDDDSRKIRDVIEREERLEKIINEIVNKDDELKKRLQISGLL